MTCQLFLEQKHISNIIEEEVKDEALGGTNLRTIAEVWMKYGLESIPEEYIKKIEGAHLLQEDLKQDTAKRQHGDCNNKGIKSHIQANKYIPKDREEKEVGKQ